jgi:hypothetical protein
MLNVLSSSQNAGKLHKTKMANAIFLKFGNIPLFGNGNKHIEIARIKKLSAD